MPYYWNILRTKSDTRFVRLFLSNVDGPNNSATRKKKTLQKFTVVGDVKIRMYFRFAISKAVTIFWDAMPWNLIEVCRHFRGMCCLHFHGGSKQQSSKCSSTIYCSILMIKAVCSPRNVRKLCKTTRRHIQENSTFPFFVYSWFI
jgi:hypothetical protein